MFLLPLVLHYDDCRFAYQRMLGTTDFGDTMLGDKHKVEMTSDGQYAAVYTGTSTGTSGSLLVYKNTAGVWALFGVLNALFANGVSMADNLTVVGPRYLVAATAVEYSAIYEHAGGGAWNAPLLLRDSNSVSPYTISTIYGKISRAGTTIFAPETLDITAGHQSIPVFRKVAGVWKRIITLNSGSPTAGQDHFAEACISGDETQIATVNFRESAPLSGSYSLQVECFDISSGTKLTPLVTGISTVGNALSTNFALAMTPDMSVLAVGNTRAFTSATEGRTLGTIWVYKKTAGVYNLVCTLQADSTKLQGSGGVGDAVTYQPRIGWSRSLALTDDGQTLFIGGGSYDGTLDVNTGLEQQPAGRLFYVTDLLTKSGTVPIETTSIGSPFKNGGTLTAGSGAKFGIGYAIDATAQNICVANTRGQFHDADSNVTIGGVFGNFEKLHFYSCNGAQFFGRA